MKQYQKLVRNVIDNGVTKMHRNGERRHLFGELMKIDLTKGFPLITTKKTNYKLAFTEILWFITGDTSLEGFRQIQREDGLKPVAIWEQNSWGGVIGPIYGHQWRFAHTKQAQASPKAMASDLAEYGWDADEFNARYFDQLQFVIENIKDNPYGSRHRMANYVPGIVGNEECTMQENIEAGKGGITPCVSFFTFSVVPPKVEGGKKGLITQLTHASCDLLLGGGVNIAEYALLAELIARETGTEAIGLNIFFSDVHVYENQIEDIEKSSFFTNEPYPLPTLEIKGDSDIYHVKLADLVIKDYKHHNFIRLPLS